MKVLVVTLLYLGGVFALPLNQEDEPLWQRSGKFEGDMVLAPNQLDLVGRNGLIDTRYRWPDRTIYYKIATNVSEYVRKTIETGLEEYHKRTCILVKEATENDKDYVFVTSEDTGCWSEVGRQGGMQELNLQHNSAGTCLSTGTIVHEFLHALGFYHQQSASDRDDYVDILWDNIQKGKEHNFEKYTPETITDFGVKYDYSSVMHYNAQAFSKNGNPTIVPKDSDAVIGQRLGFSESDVTKLNRMYGCE